MKNTQKLVGAILLFVTFTVHAQTDYVTMHDTRSNNYAPSTYSRQVKFEFKYHPAIGLPAPSNGSDDSYSALMTIAPWSDNTGPKHQQLSFTSRGVYWRKGHWDSTWEPWYKLLHADNNGKVKLGDATKEVSTSALVLGGNVNTLEFVSSDFGAGFGAKIFPVDENNGLTSLRFAVRGNSASWTDAIFIRASSNSSNGSVGVGSLPATDAKFHVQGRLVTQNEGIYARGDKGSVILAAQTGYYEKPAIYSINNSGQVQDLLINPAGGNVGMGTSAPVEQLHLASNSDHAIKLSRANGLYGFRILRDADQGWTHFQNTDDNNNPGTRLLFSEGGSGWQNVIINPSGGNVGIGVSNPDYKLTVDGNVKCEEVKVEIIPGSGPDYVFEPDYNLTPLDSVASYIREHKHLPEVPSAKQMEEEGLNLREMNLLLLKKVEELTLHLIEQNKEIVKLKKESCGSMKQSMELLLNRMKELEAEINSVEPKK